jgi:NAD(P)-dependent dehydrogenase (short-subunit alcohol dehydrogenase family)
MLERLGAQTETIEPGSNVSGLVDALVYDAGEAFAAGGADGLRDALQRGWETVAALAAGTVIPSGRGGKVILIGPRADAGGHADAARAGLENLARTLSVEWARYGITATMIAAGPASSDEQVAELVAYLVSQAGDYFSGCRFDLGRVDR